MNQRKMIAISLLISMSFGSASFAMDIWQAAGAGNNERILEILEQDPAAINSYDPHDRTALHYAAGNGHYDTAQLLLQHEAMVDATPGFLHTMSRLGWTWLLDYSGGGTTPLRCAVKNGHTDVAKLLLENKADVEAYNPYDPHEPFTALCLAAQNGHTDNVKLLLEYKAEIDRGGNADDANCGTPLHSTLCIIRTWFVLNRDL